MQATSKGPATRTSSPGSGNAGDYAYGDIVAYPFGYGMATRL